jgi:hypothetical protein
MVHLIIMFLQRYRQTDGQTDKWAGQMDRRSDGQTERWRDKQTGIQTDGTDRQADRHTSRQQIEDRQKDRWTEI